MFLTNILLKRVKSKDIMVQLESLVSGHRFNKIRPRLADKLEVIRFDPYIQKICVYREKKKVGSSLTIRQQIRGGRKFGSKPSYDHLQKMHLRAAYPNSKFTPWIKKVINSQKSLSRRRV